MRPNTAFGARSSIAVFIVTLLTLAFLGACQSRSNQDEEDEERAAQPQKPLAQISVENGQTIIALDKPTQARLGLAIASLAETLTRAQAAFPAVVLSVQDLATLRNNYVAAQAQFQKARVGANVARQEYTRLKTLYAENQNVSQKSLQSAEGALQADEADVRAAEQQLSLERSIARQAWGGVVEQWAVDGSPEFQRILDQRAVLVQMTVSPDTSTGPTPHAMPDAVIDPPKTISLEVPDGARTKAVFVSSFPRVDPRIQGRSFLYLASTEPSFAPGVDLLARLSVGRQMRGVTIPASAVVWSDGSAWAYEQVASNRFARRPVPIDFPVEHGYFAQHGFSPGDKIVTQGAQALLSTEMLLRGQGGQTDVD